MDKLLESLNDRQREAVLATDNAVLVLAGAGSGKTKVITHRFAYILREKRLSIRNILSVTFTNKAALEMKERIGTLLDRDAGYAWIRTFHSMGVMIIRKNPEVIGYPKNFVIYDDVDSKNMVKSIMKDLNVNLETYSPSSIYNSISSAKDNMILPQQFEDEADSEHKDIASKVYFEYEKGLRKNKAFDFPDLIGIPLKMFQDSPSLLSQYQDLWQYVMVDEFQDTNKTQYELVKLISAKNKNICVVGDDDQSIYSWRGAQIDNIYDFEERYKAKVILLEQNYRSTDVIIKAANEVVSHIDGRMDKNLWTEKNSEELIRLYECGTDRDESEIIAQNIRELAGKYSYKDFAVFYRTNAQSRLIEEAMLKHNLPYKVFGGQKFYERKEIKDILSYIKSVINPFDRNSFERIINVPRRGIGNVTQSKLISYTLQNNISYIETLLQSNELGNLTNAVIKKCNDLGEILLELNQSAENISPMNFVKILLDVIEYQAYITAFDADGRDRWSNVEELINSIRIFQDLNPDATIIDFINEITLQTSLDSMDEDDNRDYVSLMTIHNAKGLEFPVVFVSGIVDGLIPHVSSQSSSKEMNEERRLFYVAITRAKDILSLSYSRNRLKFGNIVYCQPSHFLDNIPKELTQREYFGMEKTSDKKKNSSPYKRNNKTPYSYQKNNEKIKMFEKPEVDTLEIDSLDCITKGEKVYHKIFGIGTVDFASEKMVMVQFDNFGQKMIGGNVLSSISKVVEK